MTLIEGLLAQLPTGGGLALIALATMVGGLMRGFTGFGAAMIIIPVVAVVAEPTDAVVFHALIELPSAVQLLPDGLRTARRTTVMPMALAVILAVPVSMYFLVILPTDVMRIIMSLIVLALVLFLWKGGRLPLPKGPVAGYVGGAAGGLLQGGAGVGGPPIAAALIARADSPRETRGNVLTMMCLLIAISLPTQYFYGLINREVLILGVVMAPVYMLTIYVGSKIFHRTGGRNYRGVAMVVLALTAIGTLWAALS